MLRKILLITLALSAVLAFEPGHAKESYVFGKFQEFLKTENKKYSTPEEYFARFAIFQTNYNKLESMTLSPDSTRTHSVGLNKFADMTAQEFRKTYRNLNVELVNVIKAKAEALTFMIDESVPASWDWREHAAVGAVKDQGQCGSCWAFSTVGNLEGLYAIKNKKQLSFSEQQLVDCDKIDSGCNGGLMENAYKYIQQAGGLELSSEYKYTARGSSCKFDKKKSAVNVTGYTTVGQDEEEIKAFLQTTGPLAIALNAEPLQFYNGGIVDSDASECDPSALDHGVTLVGYGSENGQDFWIVRNSWGSGWGENGYFRMARGKGTCGINTYVVSAKLQ
jgi:cathepsin F